MTSTTTEPVDYSGAGLEDLGEGLPVPRLKIVHDEGVFEDPNSGQKFAYLDCVIVGLVTQRAFWAEGMSTEKDPRPRCKSTDGKTGFPNIQPQTERQVFPWDHSVFDREIQPTDEKGNIALPCVSCNFKDWGADKTPPPCTEIMSLSIQYFIPDPSGLGGGDWSLGVVNFSKTGFTPTRKYLQTFKLMRRPPFSAQTRITLELNKTGMVKYSVPKFSKGAEIATEMWPEYLDMSNQIAAVLRQPPRGVDLPMIEARKQQIQLAAGRVGAQQALPSVPQPPTQAAQPAQPAQPAPVQTEPAPPPAPPSAPPKMPAAAEVPAGPVIVDADPVETDPWDITATGEDSWPSSPPQNTAPATLAPPTAAPAPAAAATPPAPPRAPAQPSQQAGVKVTGQPPFAPATPPPPPAAPTGGSVQSPPGAPKPPATGNGIAAPPSSINDDVPF